MARETFSVRFQCREQKTNKLGNAPIEMVIIINGARTTLKLPMKCKPEDFKAGTKEITEYCLEQRKRVDRALTELLRQEVPLTSENLKKQLQSSGTGSTYTLADLFAEYLTIMSKRVGRDLSKDTYNRYIKTTKMFVEYNGISMDTPAKNIKLSHLINYQVELNTKLDPATSCNYLQKIKSIFKYAFETGKIPTNPAYGLKIDKGIKDTILYLTEEELEKIENHTFGKRLQEVADVFLLSCYSGLSFADMGLLERGDFKMTKSGYLYVEKERVKTKARFCAVFLRNSKTILEKYDYNLPIKSSQKTNEYLKEIATICEIDKSLHFHMARHTAASLLINHRPEIPNETIRRIMGWKDDRQLRHYASIFNQTVFDDIEKSFGKKYVETAKPKTDTAKELRDNQDDIEAFKKILGID